jgi:hypothetical protein
MNTWRGGGGLWLPSNLAPLVWFPPSQGSLYQDTVLSNPVTATSQAVAGWADAGSAVASATNATASPTAVQLSPARVSFDGTAQNLRFSGSLVNAGAQTLFLKYKTRTAPGAGAFQTLVSPNGTAAFGRVFLVGQVSTYSALSFCLGAAYGSVTMVGVAITIDTNEHSLIIDYNGSGASTPANYTVYLDGVAQTVVASQALSRTAGDQSTLAADVSSGALSSFGPVNIGTVGYLSRQLTAAERTSLIAYMSAN